MDNQKLIYAMRLILGKLSWFFFQQQLHRDVSKINCLRNFMKFTKENL